MDRGEWTTKWVKAEHTGRKFRAVFKCGVCGHVTETATDYCANCGDAKNGKKMINQQQAVKEIRKMMDMDGFRDGDAVSRRAVIAIIEAI